MAYKFITKKHLIADNEFVMLTTDSEFKSLENGVSCIREDLKNLVTEVKLEEKTMLLNKKIEKNIEDFENIKRKLLTALSNGEWRQCFSEEIKKALATIDERYKKINTELDQKMSQLAQAGAIEEKILKIFFEQEEKFRTVIRESGKQLKSELDKKMDASNLMEMLKIESQTITWEN